MVEQVRDRKKMSGGEGLLYAVGNGWMAATAVEPQQSAAVYASDRPLHICTQLAPPHLQTLHGQTDVLPCPRCENPSARANGPGALKPDAILDGQR